MNQVELAELAQALFEEAGDALFLVDPDTDQLIDVNPMALRLSGFSRAELLRFPSTYLFRFEMPSGMHKLRQAFQETGIFHAQDGFFLRTKREGRWVPVNLSVARLHVKPKPLGLITVRDVSEQHEAYAQVKRVEAELRRVITAVPDCIWSLESEGNGRWAYRYLSPNVERLTGRPEAHFRAAWERWLDVIHPHDRPRVDVCYHRFFQSGEASCEVEYRIVRADGGVRWVLDRAHLNRGSDGRALRLDCVTSDITDRKQAESAVRESELRLQRIVETNANGILLLTPEARISFANRSAERILGRPRKELVGSAFADISWHAREPEEPEDGSSLNSTLYGQERIVTRPNGTQATVTMNSALVRDDHGEVNGAVVSFADITYRKVAEETIRVREEQLARVVEAVADGIVQVDRDRRITFANAAAERLFGRPTGQFVGTAWGDPSWQLTLLDGRPVPDEGRVDHRVLDRGESVFDSERAVTRFDGSRMVLNATAVPVRDAQGSVVGMVVSLTDITQRKRAEEALARQHTLLRALIDSIPDLIRFQDADGRYLGCNAAYETYLARNEKELVGRDDHAFFPADVATREAERGRQVLASRRPLRREEWLDYPGGRRVLVETLDAPLLAPDGQALGLIRVSRDITERKQLEEQLQHALKMEAIGQLAGGIAHDFNNLLTAILGNLALLRSELQLVSPESPVPNLEVAARDGALGTQPPSPRELLASIEQATGRAAQLTNHLLGFSRRTPLRLEPANLNSSVAETIDLLRRTIDPRIAIEVKADPDLWTVRADPGQVSQVLMNLCLNARDAMPDGGRLLIATENRDLDEAYAQLHLESRSGPFVRLRVSDTGMGIPAEIRARIFEPFFTTKPFGKGNGLGLAMVFGIVKQHQGWIDCYSEPGLGSRFDIYLPRAEQVEAVPAVPPAPAPLPAGGSETVLLVDDEPMIRNLGSIILRQFGYGVVLAEDGQEAVEVYQREGDRIDLVILDLTMPRLSGRDALRQLRQLNPAVRVLLSSGYSADHVGEADEQEVQGFVNKPYRPPDLAKAVRAALDQSSPHFTREGVGSRE